VRGSRVRDRETDRQTRTQTTRESEIVTLKSSGCGQAERVKVQLDASFAPSLGEWRESERVTETERESERESEGDT